MPDRIGTTTSQNLSAYDIDVVLGMFNFCLRLYAVFPCVEKVANVAKHGQMFTF